VQPWGGEGTGRECYRTKHPRILHKNACPYNPREPGSAKSWNGLGIGIGIPVASRRRDRLYFAMQRRPEIFAIVGRVLDGDIDCDPGSDTDSASIGGLCRGLDPRKPGLQGNGGPQF